MKKILSLVILIGKYISCVVLRCAIFLCPLSCSSLQPVGHNFNLIGDRCTVSPDGSSIVFSREAGQYSKAYGTSNLYSIKSDGTAIVQLTNSSTLRTSPWFSPDGQSLLYLSSSPPDFESNLFVLDKNGHNPRQLTFCGGPIARPSYSPDGKKIIFVRPTTHRLYSMGGMIWDNWDLWEVNADSTNLHQLTFGHFYNVNAPYFSPDGTSIIFAGEARDDIKSQHSIYICDVQIDQNVANLRKLPLPPPPENTGFDGDPSISPDGAMIAFISLRNNQTSPFSYDIWLAKSDGSGLRQLTDAHDRLSDPIFASDGKSIYYTSVSRGLSRIELKNLKTTILVPSTY